MPAEIIAVLSAFAPLMTQPTFQKAVELMTGALLCRGRRTVSSILRVLGKAQESGFERYHRVLNRNRWSCVACAQILLGLLLALLPDGCPLIVLVDETLERRKGKQIKAKGYYRDAVRSTQKTVVKCMGLKWISMMLLVPLPWSARPWALPFLTVLAPSERANAQRNRTHKTTVDWTRLMVRLVTRWIRRNWILVGDGAYACIALGHACGQAKAALVSRLRLDASLHEAPPVQPPGKRGRKPVKGKRIASLKQQALDDSLPWRDKQVTWYKGEKKILRLLTGVHLWYKPGEKPLRIRWVIVKDPQRPGEPAQAFFSTDTTFSPRWIVALFVLRWNIEVTFEETRRHLGIETQRQWSDPAIGRTTPVLMGLYSIACLIAHNLSQALRWQPACAAWYDKGNQATFSDIIALVRRAIWTARYFSDSDPNSDAKQFSRQQCNTLIELLAMAA